MAPEDYNENGVYTRLCTQFSWGSRYIPPFNHSSDALNCVASTMGKLGDWNVTDIVRLDAQKKVETENCAKQQ